MSRSQTATEYLIVLAVVIVIALLVVGVLGGIPGIGGGTGRNTDSAKLRTNKIGVMAHSLNSTSMKLMLRNNIPDTISLNSLTIEGTVCTTTNLPVILSAGRQTTIVCTNVNSSEVAGTQYEYELSINYTDVVSRATYTLDGLTLVGVVSGSAASGSDTYSLIEDDAEESVAHLGSCTNPGNAYDGDTGTGAYTSAPDGSSSLCEIFINQSIPLNIVSAVVSGFGNVVGTSWVIPQCYNYSSGSFVNITGSSIDSYFWQNFSVDDSFDCLQDTMQLKYWLYVSSSPLGGTATLNEQKVWWNVSS